MTPEQEQQLKEYREQCNLYFENGKFAEAIEIAKAILEITPFNMKVYHSIGYTYARNFGNLEEGIAWYDKGIEILKEYDDKLDSPFNLVDMLHLKVDAYFETGEYQKAYEASQETIAYLEAGYESKGIDLDAVYSELGQIYDKCGDLLASSEQAEEAEQLYLQALKFDKISFEIDPDPVTHCNLGVSYEKLKDYDNAIKEFDIAISMIENGQAEELEEESKDNILKRKPAVERLKQIMELDIPEQDSETDSAEVVALNQELREIKQAGFNALGNRGNLNQLAESFAGIEEQLQDLTGRLKYDLEAEIKNALKAEHILDSDSEGSPGEGSSGSHERKEIHENIKFLLQHITKAETQALDHKQHDELQHNIKEILLRQIQQLTLKELHDVSTKPESKDELIEKLLQEVKELKEEQKKQQEEINKHKEQIDQHEERLDSHDELFKDIKWLEEEIATIKANASLRNYYNAMFAFWSSAFTGAESIHSGKVKGDTDSFISAGESLPYIGNLCKIFGWVHSKYKAKQLKTETNTQLDFEADPSERVKLLKEMLVRIVKDEDLKEQIVKAAAAHLDQSVIDRISNKINGKKFYDTPDKILALQHGVYLMTKIIDGTLDSENIVSSSVNFLHNMPEVNITSGGKSCTIMTVNELEMPFADMLKKAEEIGGKWLQEVVFEYAGKLSEDAVSDAKEIISGFITEQGILELGGDAAVYGEAL